ncbi:nuclear transport factor 2 family protein [Bdellovibrio sp. HCB337]|uniref:nuclear transport factor 2 family protein n=1 Tax=Bdellovibrio sp. HCB337 TaxID=3394358 RepID=UPI0039A44FFA
METTASSTTKERPRRNHQAARSTTATTKKVTQPSKHLSNLLDWYSRVTAKSIKHLHQYYTKDAFFKDPLVEIYTTEEIEQYYLRVLNRISDIHFTFENIVEQGNQACVTWVMKARFMGREFSVEGSTHFKFTSNGLCEYHRDYFDVSGEIYEQVPVMGLLFRGIKRVLN